MGLLTELVLVPFAPARVAFWAVGQVVETASREYRDPAAIRRELAELSRQFDEGLIGAEEFDAREDQLLDRLDEGQPPRRAQSARSADTGFTDAARRAGT